MHFRAELIVYLRRCAMRVYSLAQNLGTRSVADGVSTLGLLLVLLLIYYALPVVCTSRYILLAKRSILTKAQVEPTMDILFQCKLYLGPKGSPETHS